MTKRMVTLALATLLIDAANCSAASDNGDPPQVGLGFHVSVIANNVSNARFMAVAPNGDLVVAETGAGRVVAINPNGAPAQRPVVVLDGLALPHGLAFRGDELYVATWSGVVRVAYPPRRIEPPKTLFSDMPEGGDHNRRALALGADGSIFVSSGSDCNVCIEPDPRFAAILHYDAQGRHASIYARGLRNASGLAFDRDGRLWAVVNGRDNIGDDLPADELVHVKAGADYGFPYCYGAHRSRIADPEFGNPARCTNAVPEDFDFQAHSAPLGIVFYEGNQFPARYRGAAFVAFHGSWNRSVPTGYKVVVVFFRDGKPASVEDFAEGWLRGDGSYSGRPAGLAVGRDGSLYVSDDYGDRIYRITYRK